jgi:hypothetical protein
MSHMSGNKTVFIGNIPYGKSVCLVARAIAHVLALATRYLILSYLLEMLIIDQACLKMSSPKLSSASAK